MDHVRVLLIVPMTAYAIGAFAQSDSLAAPPPLVVDSNEAVSWAVVEVKPMFPGGESERLEYLRKSVKYPRRAAKNKITGTVYIDFVIGKDGTIGQPRVVRSAHPLLDAEALRVVKGMPAWTVGLQQGKPVPVRFTMPIKFSLRNGP